MRRHHAAAVLRGRCRRWPGAGDLGVRPGPGLDDDAADLCTCCSARVAAGAAAAGRCCSRPCRRRSTAMLVPRADVVGAGAGRRRGRARAGARHRAGYGGSLAGVRVPGRRRHGVGGRACRVRLCAVRGKRGAGAPLAEPALAGLGHPPGAAAAAAWSAWTTCRSVPGAGRWRRRAPAWRDRAAVCPSPPATLWISSHRRTRRIGCRGLGRFQRLPASSPLAIGSGNGRCSA